MSEIAAAMHLCSAAGKLRRAAAELDGFDRTRLLAQADALQSWSDRLDAKCDAETAEMIAESAAYDAAHPIFEGVA